MSDAPEIRVTLAELWDGIKAEQAHARSTDPSTSHEAAASVKPLTMTRSRVAVLAVLEGGDATQEQIYDSTRGFTPSRIRTAVRELADRGMVQDTGRKHPTSTGRPAIVWRITLGGEQAYYSRTHLL